MKLPDYLASYQKSIDQAVAYVRSITNPCAIVVTGSIVRGNPGPSSDIDMVVLHKQQWRQRIQKKFELVPFEIFINDAKGYQTYLKEEPKSGRPVMPHMLATGLVLFDDNAQIEPLIESSKLILAQGPLLTNIELNAKKYAAATLVEDAADFVATPNSLDAMLVRAKALDAVIDYYFLSCNKFIPRHKEKLEIFVEDNQKFSSLVAAVLGANGESAINALNSLAVDILGVAGFYEWDSLRTKNF